jgi:hypothetical protein
MDSQDRRGYEAALTKLANLPDGIRQPLINLHVVEQPRRLWELTVSEAIRRMQWEAQWHNMVGDMACDLSWFV